MQLYYNREEFADIWAGLSAKIGAPFGKKVVLGAHAVLTAAVLAVSVWSIRLLTQKEVKRVFQPHLNSDRRSGLFPAISIVLLLAMAARETGGFSLDYFTCSQEGTSSRIRNIVNDMNDGFDLRGFEAPCLIEVRGMGEERYRVVTTFTVRRDGGETSTHWESRTYGGLATAQVPHSLRDGADRIVIEIDTPQLSGGYWLPLSKHFTAEYRARIHGEGKYESFQDEVTEKRDLTVSGLCSVYHLKQFLLAQTENEAFAKIMNAARQAADLPKQLKQRGNNALEAEHYDRAIEDFSKAIRLDPTDAYAFYCRGLAWRRKQEYDKAIQDYDEAIRLDPKYVHAFNDRGVTWNDKGDHERAIKDYDEAIRLDPEYVYAFNNRGVAWRDKEEYDKAIRDFDEAIRLDPRYSLAFRNRGIAWRDKKEYDKAIKDFDEAFRLDSNTAGAFINVGDAWHRKKEYGKAIMEYDEAIRLNPNHAYAFYRRGLAGTAKEEYDKAIKDCDEAIRLDPKDGWSHYYRSVAQLLDRRAKAVDGFQTVLELQGWKGHLSQYAVVLGHLAARQAGNEPAAKRFLKDSAGKLNETWPYPVVQFLRGDIDEAALLNLSTDDDKRTEARCFLGIDHAIKGRKGEALAHFRWVKEHGNTSYTEYTIAVAELERLERPAEEPKR